MNQKWYEGPRWKALRCGEMIFFISLLLIQIIPALRAEYQVPAPTIVVCLCAVAVFGFGAYRSFSESASISGAEVVGKLIYAAMNGIYWAFFALWDNQSKNLPYFSPKGEDEAYKERRRALMYATGTITLWAIDVILLYVIRCS